MLGFNIQTVYFMKDTSELDFQIHHYMGKKTQKNMTRLTWSS